jgi:hypothetical protein
MKRDHGKPLRRSSCGLLHPRARYSAEPYAGTCNPPRGSMDQWIDGSTDNGAFPSVALELVLSASGKNALSNPAPISRLRSDWALLTDDYCVFTTPAFTLERVSRSRPARLVISAHRRSILEQARRAGFADPIKQKMKQHLGENDSGTDTTKFWSSPIKNSDTDKGEGSTEVFSLATASTAKVHQASLHSD